MLVGPKPFFIEAHPLELSEHHVATLLTLSFSTDVLTSTETQHCSTCA